MGENGCDLREMPWPKTVAPHTLYVQWISRAKMVLFIGQVVKSTLFAYSENLSDRPYEKPYFGILTFKVISKI